jgi:hypothetical protein
VKLFWSFLGLAFGLALAVIIGQRMSTDAMAVVIGVVVGVVASVPTSVLMVALLRRGQRRPDSPPAPPPYGYGYPPVQVPPVMLDPTALFGRMQPPGPTMTVGENFQLLPSTQQDGRFRFEVPRVDWDKEK